MKRLLLAALLLATPAAAQQANVVNNCGSVAPFGALTAGQQFFPTIDVNGRLCLQGGGGSGGSAYTLPTASTTILGGVKIDGTSVHIDGSGVISAGGSPITANTTPTSGFVAGQAVVSDGSKVQATKAGTSINMGDASYPLYITGYNNTIGSNPNISFGSGNLISMYVSPGPYVGVSMPGGDNPGVYYQNTYFGFNTDTNSPGGGLADTAFTTIKNSTAGFRNVGSGLTAEDLRVYNTFTNFTNSEWGGFDWKSFPNILTVGTGANGTGTARKMVLNAPTVDINALGSGTVHITNQATPTSYPHGVWLKAAPDGIDNYIVGYLDGTIPNTTFRVSGQLDTNGGWTIKMPNDDPRTGGTDTGANFEIDGINHLGIIMPPALKIDRATSVVTLAAVPSIPGAASCAAGTVSLTTLVVTNGIITHC